MRVSIVLLLFALSGCAGSGGSREVNRLYELYKSDTSYHLVPEKTIMRPETKLLNVKMSGDVELCEFVKRSLSGIGATLVNQGFDKRIISIDVEREMSKDDVLIFVRKVCAGYGYSINIENDFAIVDKVVNAKKSVVVHLKRNAYGSLGDLRQEGLSFHQVGDDCILSSDDTDKLRLLSESLSNIPRRSQYKSRLYVIEMNKEMTKQIDSKLLAKFNDIEFSKMMSSGGAMYQAQITKNSLDFLFAYLKTTFNATIYSKPYIIVQESDVANISLGRSVPYIVQQQQSVSTGSNIINAIQYRDIGLTLNYTLNAVRDSIVKVNFQYENSSMGGGGVLGNPVFLQDKFSTVFEMDIKNVVLLGGVDSRNVSKRRDGVGMKLVDLFVGKAEDKSSDRQIMICLDIEKA